jgi:hypothetical protein
VDHLQLEIVDALSALLESHGPRVVDVEDHVEQRDLDLAKMSAGF